MAIKTNNLVACGECDALHREVALPPRGLAQCSRCGAELYRDKPESLDRTLALVVAAAVAFLLANAYPLMELDARGIRTTANLIQTASVLWQAGMPSVAIVVFLSVIALPGMQVAAMLYMLVPLRMGEIPPRIYLAYRLVNWAQPWAMVDVFLLGAVVSLVRLTQVAKIYPDLGIYAVAAFVLLSAAAVASFEPRALWRRVEALGERLPRLQEEGRA